MENKAAKRTHLTFSDRNRIQGGLANKDSFKEIGFELHKSPSTISREIKSHMFIKKNGRHYSRCFNDCLYRKVCNMHFELNPIKPTLFDSCKPYTKKIV
jgi:IS30 family transposase